MFLYWSEYIKAMRNEEAIDKSFYRAHGANPSSFGYIPRPLIWLSKHKSNNKFIYFIAILIKLSLFLGGWFFLFILELAKVWSSSNGIDSKRCDFDCIIMAFSERTYDVIKKNKSFISSSYTLMYFPWNTPPSGEKNYINCYSFISKWEAVKILFSSLIFIYYSFFIKNNTWVLQYYTMYRWMLVRHAVSKVSAKTYICTEHFDRWAILLDCALQEKNEMRGVGCRFMLFQHGILKRLSADGKHYINDFEFNLPSRLSMVTDIYAYDQESIDVFRNNIISDCVVISEIKFNVVSVGFSLVSESLFNKNGIVKSVLLVGHPLCFEQQLTIYKNISELAFVYYKPHPTVMPSDDMLTVGWEVIKDKDYFPKVDFLISYPSTLVVEYQTQGIDSIVHPLNANFIDVDKCIVSTLKRLGHDIQK